MRLLILLTLSCAALPLIVKDVGEDEGRPEDPTIALQGEWTVISLGFSGYELRRTGQQPMKVTFIKDRMVTRPAYSVSGSFSFASYFPYGFTYNRSTSISLSERDLKRLPARPKQESCPNRSGGEEWRAGHRTERDLPTERGRAGSVAFGNRFGPAR